MATSKEFKSYVEQSLIDILGEVVCRPMMGEILLYHDGTLFGGIYDGRVLIKRCENNAKFNLPLEIPYQGAKPMCFIEDLENRELVREVILETCKAFKK